MENDDHTGSESYCTSLKNFNDRHNRYINEICTSTERVAVWGVGIIERPCPPPPRYYERAKKYMINRGTG